MACFLLLLAAFAPRLVLLLLWIFTPLVTRAIGGLLLPLVGLIFLPFTTLFYVLAWNPATGVSGAAWLWVFLGLLLDISAYGGGAYGRRRR
ncbi:MAG: hypothetical protein ACUVX9_09980 [Anaerolineae bacterium]